MSRRPENSRPDPENLTMRHKEGKEYLGFPYDEPREGRVIGWIRRTKQGGSS